MKKWKFALIILIFFGLHYGCKKRCTDVTCDPLKCDYGYNSINFPITFITDGIYNTLDSNYIIKDSVTYDSTFNHIRHFGNIDFNNQFIIGVHKVTNEGEGINKIAAICENAIDHKLKFKVNYALTGQCNGSKAYKQVLSAWVLLPIKYKTYTIEYDVKDINPF